MSKYFIDTEIYYQNKRLPPRKVKLPIVINNSDNKTALCYDDDGNEYFLNRDEIFEDDNN